MNNGKTWNEISLIASFNISSMYPSSDLYEVRSNINSLDKIEMIFYYRNPNDINPHHLLVILEDKEEKVTEINTTWTGDIPINLISVKVSLEEAIEKVKDLNLTCVSLRSPINLFTSSPKYMFGNDYTDYKVYVDSITGEVTLI